MNPYETIGATLRELRVKCGLSQEVVAEKLGMTRANVSQIESGKIATRLETLIAFARLLGAELNVQILVGQSADQQLSDRVCALIPRLPPPARRSLEALVAIWEEEPLQGVVRKQ